jgi:LmbE family N-acetylglucosaminyl deacetylase
VPELFRRVPGSVVAIYAHPDDPDVSCGGTLAAWSEAGCEVTVVVCTDGDKGTNDPCAAGAALAERRAAESERAAAVLGVAHVERLRYADGELAEETALRSRLVEVIRRRRPEIVLCPDPTAVFFGQEYFNHRDHRACGWAALDAAAPAAALPLYYPETGPPHQVAAVLLSGTLDPDVWVDISRTIGRKDEAVGCHLSQFADGGSQARAAVRLGAARAGGEVGVEFAEAYRRLWLGSAGE